MEVPESEDPFDRLVQIVRALRSEDGCPWDREQTMQSLVECLEEETEEVVRAVENGDMENLEEELGDLILQGVFYAQIAKERGLFEVGDVLETVNSKLVERHPHVFGEEDVDSPEEALEQWNQSKESS